jgi:hypothetical protein
MTNEARNSDIVSNELDKQVAPTPVSDIKQVSRANSPTTNALETIALFSFDVNFFMASCTSNVM